MIVIEECWRSNLGGIYFAISFLGARLVTLMFTVASF